MPIEILMPALSPTMTEGNLAKWLKKEGDEVKSGDVIAEIETDKATMEVEAVDEGKIGKILVPEGAEGVKVNAADRVAAGGGRGRRRRSATLAPPKPGRDPLPAAPPPQPCARRPSHGRQPGRAAARQRRHGNGERIFASPLARRMAQQAGLDLAAIRGTGPHGRIVKADIEAALCERRRGAVPTGAAPAATPAPPAAPARAGPVQGAGGRARRQPALHRAAAHRDAPGHRPAPDRIQADRPAFLSDGRLRDRRAVEDSAPSSTQKSEAYRISVNDFVIRAAALALRQVPAANASWSDEAILLWDTVDISVAVAIDDGLITPIVKQCRPKGLAAIANEIKDLAARARAGKLKLEEFQGGTLLDLQPRHVRHPRFRRGHQPAAWRHPGGRRRRAAAGGQERRAGDRNGDELHARPAITASSTARSAPSSSPPSRSSSKTR